MSATTMLETIVVDGIAPYDPNIWSTATHNVSHSFNLEVVDPSDPEQRTIMVIPAGQDFYSDQYNQVILASPTPKVLRKFPHLNAIYEAII